LVEQFSGYESISGFFIDGAYTLGENIGDLGGVEVAFDAYQRSLNGEVAPIIDGLTGEQRFFLAYAQAWRVIRREDLALRLLKSDSHSPPKYRVNGILRNIDAWYDAFDVKPEHALWLAPEERVQIW
jgi:predicted metalloendopeptidase